MKNKSTSEILDRMREIYYPGKNKSSIGYLDWMGYEIDKLNTPTYHHIERAIKQKNESPKPTIENGAYLGNLSHDVLHVIERLDKNLYNEWNSLFKQIIKLGIFPTEEIWNQIE